jgi:hypothetical protein
MDADADAAARRGPLASSRDPRAVHRASRRRGGVPAGHDRPIRDPEPEPGPPARGDRRAARRDDPRSLRPAAAPHVPSGAGAQLQPGSVRPDDRAHRRAGAADRRHLDNRSERSERGGDAEEGRCRPGRSRRHRPPPQPRLGRERPPSQGAPDAVRLEPLRLLPIGARAGRRRRTVSATRRRARDASSPRRSPRPPTR